jgi:hypothetical protein
MVGRLRNELVVEGMTMECRECDRFIHDFERAETVSGEMRTKILNHVARCARCEARFSSIRSLERALRALGENIDSEQSVTRMEPVLRTIFAQRREAKQRSGPVARWVAIGMAASLLFSIGIVSWQRMFAPQATPAALAAPKATPVAEASAVEALVAPAGVSPKTRNHRRSKPRIPAEPAVREEIVTGFYALPYAESSGRVFSGEIVRVKLTGSALPAIGFPVALNGDRAAEQITADLFLGENGLPLAIRFVR